MNDARRKQLADLSDRLMSIQQDLANLQEEEQEAFDNLPDSFQNGEKGEKAQAALDALEEAFNALDEAIQAIETAKE